MTVLRIAWLSVTVSRDGGVHVCGDLLQRKWTIYENELKRIITTYKKRLDGDASPFSLRWRAPYLASIPFMVKKVHVRTIQGTGSRIQTSS